MKQKAFYSFISVLLALLLALPSAFAVTQEDIDRVQSERDELAEKQEQTQSKIDQLKEKKASVIEQKEALDERNTIAAEQLDLIQQQIDLYNELIEEKARDVEDARADEELQLERYRVRVRAMEENGSYDILALLLNAGSFSELLSAFDDINSIMEADQMLEDNYVEARQRHEETKAEYEELKSNLEDRESELLEEQEALRQMIEEATELIKSLEEDIEQAQKEYEEAERAREAADYQISLLIEELNRQRKPAETPKPSADPTPSETDAPPPAETQDPTPAETDAPPPAETSEPAPSETEEPTPTPSPEPGEEPGDNPGEQSPGVVGSGSLIWPVPCSHVVTSRYGMRINPISGEEKMHTGIDIDGYGNDGGAIIACDAGVVVSAEWYGGYGNCVIIDHGNGMQTLYGHMSGFAVSAGDTVTQGQTIGYLGSTGWSTGTHCHLEVFVNGSRVDPAGYFSGITYYDC